MIVQIIDVDATKTAQKKGEKAKPVVIAGTSATLVNKEETRTWEIQYKLATERILDKTVILSNYVYGNKETFEVGGKPIAKDISLSNQAQIVSCIVECHASIQTKTRPEDDSQTFIHGDMADMFDDMSITHDILDGSKEAFETILYALLPDGINKEIWKSGRTNYEVNDKEFIKAVPAEKVDTGEHPEGVKFILAEISYDKDGDISGKRNGDLKEESQALAPKGVPTVLSTPEQPEAPIVPGSSQESSPTVKTFPQTREESSNVLLFIDFTLIFATVGYYSQNHRN